MTLGRDIRFSGSLSAATSMEEESANLNTARVTVVIPAYNRPQLIWEAVSSALAQGDLVSEVLVIDDYSNPPVELRSDFAGNARVRVTKNSGRKGALGARMRGLEIASNDLVAFLDSDDVLTPASIQNRLHCYRQAIGADPDKPVGLIYGDVTWEGRSLKLIRCEGDAWATMTKELALCPFSAILVDRRLAPKLDHFEDLPAWQDDAFVISIDLRP